MKDQFMDWLTKRASDCEANRAALSADGRGDEARFEQIRYNVYDLFRTAVGAIHRAETDEKAAWWLFERRLKDIPSTWQRSHDLAKLHGDEEKAHIEQVKLHAAAEIEERYRALRGADA